MSVHSVTSRNLRHGYHRSSPESPANLTPHQPTDAHDQFSPSGSTTILTPDGHGPILSGPKMSPDHPVLSPMSQQPTPRLAIPDSSSVSRGFPLLPPHHPLRSKMLSTNEQPPTSPAHTPKGHPIEKPGFRTYFNLDYESKAKSNPLTHPFAYGERTFTSSLAYFLRIPRRLRPVLLIGVCLITFGLVFLSRAMSHARHMDHALLHNQQTGFTRRQIEMAMTNNQHPLYVEQSENPRHAQTTPKHRTGPSLVFQNAQEEIAALISFVTSTTANALPALDPSAPLDPNVVLDFDPAHPNAREDLELLQSEMNTIYPIVLIGKMRDPWHREIKRILAQYKITPSPLVIDVDQRRDHSVIIPLLARLLGTSELPQVLLQGTSLGSYHDILDLRDAGTLSDTLEASGVISIRELKKKKGLREKERIENERILAPAPIVEV